MTAEPAIHIDRLSHSYATRQALCELSLDVKANEIFVLLGPNGSGKSTLFRVLSTLMRHERGEVCLLGHRLPEEIWTIRQSIGVVFQSASLDKKLTVEENLRHQGALYGLRGSPLAVRVDELLQRLGLLDRRRERAETLSGGLRRRVELAKGLIHRPQLILMDEPSTGLDPGARVDLWEYLTYLKHELGVTVVLTTHLLEEAEKADQIGILSEGRLVALDTPANLSASVGGDSITIETTHPAQLSHDINQRFQCAARVIDATVRMEIEDGHRWITQLVEAFPGRIDTITLGKPTLEDVFIDRTGHRFFRNYSEASST